VFEKQFQELAVLSYKNLNNETISWTSKYQKFSFGLDRFLSMLFVLNVKLLTLFCDKKE
jgi:hypothetical protein